MFWMAAFHHDLYQNIEIAFIINIVGEEHIPLLRRVHERMELQLDVVIENGSVGELASYLLQFELRMFGIDFFNHLLPQELHSFLHLTFLHLHPYNGVLLILLVNPDYEHPSTSIQKTYNCFFYVVEDVDVHVFQTRELFAFHELFFYLHFLVLRKDGFAARWNIAFGTHFPLEPIVGDLVKNVLLEW